MLSATDGPDGDRRTVDIPAQDAQIVGDSGVRSKDALGLAVKLVGVGDAGDATHDDLRGKVRESLASQMVGQLVEAELSKGLGLPCLFTKEVTGSVGELQRLQEQGSLLISWQQLDFGSELHSSSIAQGGWNVKCGKEDRHSSPQ